MPIKVYVSGTQPRNAVTPVEWLRRSGFEALTTPALSTESESIAAIRPEMAKCEIVLIFARPKRAGAAGRIMDAELGIAIGLNKRIVLVGKPDHPLHTSPHINRYEKWSDAESAFRLPKYAPQPEANSLLDRPDYALKFWAEYAKHIVTIPQFLDPYAPGTSDRAQEHTNARVKTYMNALSAWREAGKPKSIIPQDETDVSPESEAYAEHLAMLEWFGDCVKLAEIDRERTSLDVAKESLIRTTLPKRRRR